jgi:hypothetical protein
MHPARSAPTSQFSAAAVAALRCGLQAQLGPSPNGELRRAVRLLCDEAHRRGLRAEQVIVLLKEAWGSLPDVQVLAPGEERRESLSRIVSLCIDEFYAARD